MTKNKIKKRIKFAGQWEGTVIAQGMKQWQGQLKRQYNRHRAKSTQTNKARTGQGRAWLCKTCMSVNQDTEQICGYCESPRPCK